VNHSRALHHPPRALDHATRALDHTSRALRHTPGTSLPLTHGALLLHATDVCHGLGLFRWDAGRLEGLDLLLAVVVHDHTVLAGLLPDLLEGLLEVVGLGGHALQLCRVQFTQFVLVLAQRPLLTVQRLSLFSEFEDLSFVVLELHVNGVVLLLQPLLVPQHLSSLLVVLGIVGTGRGGRGLQGRGRRTLSHWGVCTWNIRVSTDLRGIALL